jgi:hypothetical protein
MLKAKIKKLEDDAVKSAELLVKEQHATVAARSLYNRTNEENVILRKGESKFGDLNNFNSVSARYFKQTDDGKQAPAPVHGPDWYYKKDQSFWRLVTSMTDPDGGKDVINGLIVRAVEKRGSKLPGLLLDTSTKMKAEVSSRHTKHVNSIQKSEKHQAKSLMATLSTRMGRTKKLMFSNILYTTTYEKLLSDAKYIETGVKYEQLRTTETTAVAGLGEIKTDMRLMSNFKHKQIFNKIKFNKFTNWLDERYDEPQLIDSSWLSSPVDGEALKMPSPDFEIGMCPLEGAIENEIKLYLEHPDIAKHLRWVYGDSDSPQKNHFVFVIATDGFPRTKEKGSTETLLQCLNLGGGINQSDFNRILHLADLDETSADMDELMKHLNAEVEIMLEKSKQLDLQVEVTVPLAGQDETKRKDWKYETKTVMYTVDFFFKADLKYVQHALGAMPASAKNSGLLVEMTKEKAMLFTDQDEVVFISYKDRLRWMKEVDELYAKKFDAEKHVTDKQQNDLRNECANKVHGQKSMVLLWFACEKCIPDGMHAEMNYTKKWVMFLNSAANNMDLLADSSLCPKYGIGPVQMKLHAAMDRIGHHRYAERLRNQKSEDEHKRKKSEVRFTGKDCITVYKHISAYNDSLQPPAGEDEHPFDLELRIRLRTEMLIQARMSDVYSRYEMTRADVAALKEAGYHLLSLWQTGGNQPGLNDFTIAVVLPSSLEKWFDYFRFGNGEKALGGGITGSAQGAEGKHANTKEQAKMTDGKKGWTVVLMWKELVRRFLTLHLSVSDPLKEKDTSTSTYRYPEEAEMKTKYKESCSSCLIKLSSENTAATRSGAGEHDVSQSGTGVLNYTLDTFETDFLHFDASLCCKNCAISVDYLREVVYPRHRQGIWKATMDKEVAEAFEDSRQLATAEIGVVVNDQRVRAKNSEAHTNAIAMQVQMQLDADDNAADARDQLFAEADEQACVQASDFRQNNAHAEEDEFGGGDEDDDEDEDDDGDYDDQIEDDEAFTNADMGF